MEHVAADRRGGIDFPARRRAQGDSRDRDTLEPPARHASRFFRTIVLGVLIGLVAGVAARAAGGGGQSCGQTETQSSRTLDRIGTDHYIRRGTSRSISATRRSTPTKSSSSPTRTGRSQPATWSSRKPTAGSPPIAPTSTLKTKLGTFYNAWGMAPVGPQKRDRIGARTVAALAGGLFGSVRRPGIASQALTRKPTSTSSARRSRKPGRGNTRSPTAASRPACSRRRAGSSTHRPSC